MSSPSRWPLSHDPCPHCTQAHPALCPSMAPCRPSAVRVITTTGSVPGRMPTASDARLSEGPHPRTSPAQARMVATHRPLITGPLRGAEIGDA